MHQKRQMRFQPQKNTVFPQREPLGVAVLFVLWTIMVFDSHYSKNVGHAVVSGTCTLGGEVYNVLHLMECNLCVFGDHVI